MYTKLKSLGKRILVLGRHLHRHVKFILFFPPLGLQAVLSPAKTTSGTTATRLTALNSTCVHTVWPTALNVLPACASTVGPPRATGQSWFAARWCAEDTRKCQERKRERGGRGDEIDTRDLACQEKNR